MRKMKGKLVLAGAAAATLAATSSYAVGTVPTELQTALDTGDAVFTAVKILAVSLLVFAIGVRLVRRFSK